VSIPSSGLKVLVIDDSNTIRRSAEIFLKQGGHEVLLAEDGFDKARGRMVGSQDYLTKPFTKDQLLQTVTELGSLKQGVMQ